MLPVLTEASWDRWLLATLNQVMIIIPSRRLNTCMLMSSWRTVFHWTPPHTLQRSTNNNLARSLPRHCHPNNSNKTWLSQFNLNHWKSWLSTNTPVHHVYKTSVPAKKQSKSWTTFAMLWTVTTHRVLHRRLQIAINPKQQALSLKRLVTQLETFQMSMPNRRILQKKCQSTTSQSVMQPANATMSHKLQPALMSDHQSSLPASLLRKCKEQRHLKFDPTKKSTCQQLNNNNQQLKCKATTNSTVEQIRGVDSQEFATTAPPPEPEIDYESNAIKQRNINPGNPLNCDFMHACLLVEKRESLPAKVINEEPNPTSVSSGSSKSTASEQRRPAKPVHSNNLLNRSVPNRATVTRKTRTYVVDGVQVTSTSLHVSISCVACWIVYFRCLVLNKTMLWG